MTKDMTRDIAAMIGSRICHDLISPVGAISNGVELLAMSAGDTSAELSLISESVDNANARVKFFRIAFGMASQGQMTGRQEMVSILKGLETPRQTYDWQPTTDMLRDEVKLACLMVMCIETALPRGGAIQISSENGQLQVTARSDRLDPSPELWARLGAVSTPDGLKPNEVQFILAPLQADLLGRRICSQDDAGALRLMA
ncbi:histidine phosphotransferase ChpT [Pacificibacter maritimus]|uniref:Histidine phosphotransferase ChpT n=1 Tax=Pacificibacter maritimus TaxID=762213 RepID=A0A3N4V2U1_9RHOB|nr:histidine phosphotransferase family protein [Pacificibacter maritimus]RPE71417.1 histidine phosphotransferase ChpT [Pacificibacter maritimus]